MFPELGKFIRIGSLPSPEVQEAVEEAASVILEDLTEKFGALISRLILATESEPEKRVTSLGQLSFLAQTSEKPNPAEAEKSEVALLQDDIRKKTQTATQTIIDAHASAIAPLLLRGEGSAEQHGEYSQLWAYLLAKNWEGFYKELENITCSKKLKWKNGYDIVIRELVKAFETSEPQVRAVDCGSMGYYYMDALSNLLTQLDIGLKIVRVGGNSAIYELQRGRDE